MRRMTVVKSDLRDRDAVRKELKEFEMLGQLRGTGAVDVGRGFGTDFVVRQDHGANVERVLEFCLLAGKFPAKPKALPRGEESYLTRRKPRCRRTLLRTKCQTSAQIPQSHG